MVRSLADRTFQFRWKEAAASTIADTIAGYKKVAVELCAFQTKNLLEDAERRASMTGFGK